jgi:hypothetical protein
VLLVCLSPPQPNSCGWVSHIPTHIWCTLGTKDQAWYPASLLGPHLPKALWALVHYIEERVPLETHPGGVLILVSPGIHNNSYRHHYEKTKENKLGLWQGKILCEWVAAYWNINLMLTIRRSTEDWPNLSALSDMLLEWRKTAFTLGLSFCKHLIHFIYGSFSRVLFLCSASNYTVHIFQTLVHDRFQINRANYSHVFELLF